MNIIEVENISKEYKVEKKFSGLKGAIKSLVNREYETINAVKNINLSIKKGEIIGYIGPNGAGKSTTIKILTGILHPTTGHVFVYGIEPYLNRKQNAKNIGVSEIVYKLAEHTRTIGTENLKFSVDVKIDNYCRRAVAK